MVTKAIRPAIFKWRHTEPELILCAVRWYLRYSLSFRDVEELLSERGLEVDHTTIWRWVQRYGPELEEEAAPGTPARRHASGHAVRQARTVTASRRNTTGSSPCRWARRRASTAAMGGTIGASAINCCYPTLISF